MSYKGKGKGKAKETARKHIRFINEEAQQRFEMIHAIPMIFERGFKMETRAWSLSYTLQIHALGWETFCHPRTEAILSWVYEFYANAWKNEDDKVMVRGKFIDVSANAINEVFAVSNAEKFVRLRAAMDPNEIATAVSSTPDPQWAGHSMKALKSTSLSREAKVWLLFVNANLIPTRHLNNVTLDRLVLIYNILKGHRFNVGEVINKHIRLKAKEEKAKHLWFPTLITELCRRAGIAQGGDDLVTQVGHHITETVVEVNIKVADEFESHSRSPRKKTLHDAASGSEGRPEKLCIPSGEGAVLSDVMDSIEYMKAYHRCQHRYFRSRLDYVQKNQILLLQKAKIPVPAPIFDFQWQFDESGYLLDEDFNNLDPTEYVESDQEEQEEDTTVQSEED